MEESTKNKFLLNFIEAALNINLEFYKINKLKVSGIIFQVAGHAF